ncbi:MAG: hypothetical protein Q4C34_09445 [Bacteroidales bacterium]|nr:hypothetical protein [Bacteroidales bacterium]
MTQTNTGRRAAICSMTTSLGLLAIAVAIVLPLLSGGFTAAPAFRYIYAGGALVCLLSSLFNPNTATGLRERRWHRIEAWSSIFFCAAAAFLFVPGTAPREWLAITLAGAVLRIICFARTLFRKK